MDMNVRKIGGPYLDDFRCDLVKDNTQREVHSITHHVEDRKPIITPLIDGHDGKQYQFILVPNADSIHVLNMEHGQRVAILSPRVSNQNIRVIINTITLMNLPNNWSSKEEWVVVSGCSDGMLREWVLDCSSFATSGRIPIKPKRIVSLSKSMNINQVTHLSSCPTSRPGVLYALCRTNCDWKTSFIRIYYPALKLDMNCSEEEIRKDNAAVLATFVDSKHAKKSDTTINLDNPGEVAEFRKASVPIALQCAGANSDGDCFAVIATKTDFTIYCEKSHSNTTSEKFTEFKNTDPSSKICAVAISPHCQDLAVGFQNGNIILFLSILNLTSAYLERKGLLISKMKTSTMKHLEHPSKTVVTRQLHWHCRQVKSLCFLGSPVSRAAPILLSGGEESVLVSWNLERGTNRYTSVIPRLTKGCIASISTNFATELDSKSGGTNSADMKVIVQSMDNTMQLIHGHNQTLGWKIQGLANAMNECSPSSFPQSQSKHISLLKIDPRTRVPMLSRLSGAPGFIHWYDPISERVIGELEVSTYNRLTSQLPRPTVQYLAQSKNGNDIITIDIMQTYNQSVGMACVTEKKGEMSLTTNIKFWTRSNQVERNKETKSSLTRSMPYEMVAAMPLQHGIDAVNISNDGNRACTLSRSELCFHIWKKADSNSMGNNDSISFPEWKLICKKSIPSGYANSISDYDWSNIIAYSCDASVMAIVFGKHITLWDTNSTTMLNTICVPEPIKHIEFTKQPFDMILAVGRSTVSVLSPFGRGYLSSQTWCYKLPPSCQIEDGIRLQLGPVILLESRNEVAITLVESACSCVIILLDAFSGKPKKKFWKLESNIESICEISNVKNGWTDDGDVLLVMNNLYEMLILGEKSVCEAIPDQHSSSTKTQALSEIEMNGLKRKRNDISFQTVQTAKETIAPIFSTMTTPDLSTLNTAFTRALFQKKLKRGNGSLNV